MKDFYQHQDRVFLVERDKMEPLMKERQFLKTIAFHKRVGVIGFDSFSLEFLQYWKSNYKDDFWITGFCPSDPKQAKAYWQNSNLISDWARNYDTLVDHVRTPIANAEGEERNHSGIFIICLDDEEHDECLNKLNPLLKPGDIIIDHSKKKFVLIQNDRYNMEFPFELLNFITNN